MPHPSFPFSPHARCRAARLGAAALTGLAVAAAVAFATRPALALLEGGAERDLAAGAAVLRLAEATGRLAAATPLLAEARTGTARLEAHADLLAQARELADLAAEVGRNGLPRTASDGLRRPLARVEGEIEDLDRAVEARIAVDAELHDALAQVPQRHAALRGALTALTEEALQAGARAAERLALRDAIADRAQRLADQLITGEDQEAFRADARALETLLTRLPIGAAGVGQAEAARQLVALGLDAGNLYDLRREQARLAGLIAEMTRTGRVRAQEVSQLARRTADGLRDTAGSDHATATGLLRAAPVLGGALAGVAVLGMTLGAAGRRRAGVVPPAQPAAQSRTAAGDASSGLRVLLAEDEPLTRTVATALLRRAGHTVTAVDDGRAALEAVQAQPFDLVLLDLRMPEMDGAEALRRIRALPDRGKARVRVVVLTASAVAEDAERCRAAGADAVLAKPLRLDALLPVLEGRTTPPAEEEPPAFDAGALRQMLDALPAERVGTLIGGTLRALDEYRAALRTAWGLGDRATVSAMAHKLAGVAGVYGCPALRRAAQAMERGVEAGGDVPPLLADLEAAYGPAVEALERERGKLPSAAK